MSKVLERERERERESEIERMGKWHGIVERRRGRREGLKGKFQFSK